MTTRATWIPENVTPSALNPIIYVRGFAQTRGEIDETTADPFCGFNIGSAVDRAVPDRTKQPRKFIFESPVVRLAKDFGYFDVYLDGEDVVDQPDVEGISRQSIVVYRYYESASAILGTSVTPSISDFGRGLGELVLRVRDRVLADPDAKKSGMKPDDFRCYLVAHSMGGLVCRAFLQNPHASVADARKYVDKFFTYATPHNGVDLAGINVPAWLAANDINNFNREEMAKYLAIDPTLYKKTDRVDWIPEEAFPSEKIFCLVGTDRIDYEAARGLARTFVGHGSDGLVRIENAVVCGTRAGGSSPPTAKAFTYRAHSGYFGIVNSEEAYQNLTRFLFGDIRVDMWVDIESLTLPEAVQKLEDEGKEVDALYQIEVLASPRGKLWYLTRRIAEEDSVACLRHQEYVAAAGKTIPLHLSTMFLANRAKVDPTRKSVAYSLSLGIRVPDYEVDRRLWVNEHYEGGYVFRDSVVIEIVPPTDAGGGWTVKHDWQSDNLGKAETPVDVKALAAGKIEVAVPFASDTRPGAKGQVRFVVGLWNV